MVDNVFWKVLQGDNRDTIKTLEDNSIQTVISSPPYWAQRIYSDSELEIGIEETPEEYIKSLCDVFDAILPKLKDDGTLWINLGDTYASNAKEGIKKFGSKDFQEEHKNKSIKVPGRKLSGNLKPKDLVGVPWMFAFEMRARGWWLRQDILWSRANPIPESVEDRCTKSHEYIFLLSKSPDYYFDFNAIKEKASTTLKDKKKAKVKSLSFDELENDKEEVKEEDGKSWEPDGTRRKRSVWEVPAACSEAVGN